MLRLGRAALRARTGPESDVYDALRPLLRSVGDWPDRVLRITAVDALSGQLTAFDADSDVTLLEAVAASCAVPVIWPPITLTGRRWMDGGSRSTANIHLACGHHHVLAIAPIPAAVGPHPSAEQQAAVLAAEGAHVTLVTPDRAARRAMGRDMTSDERRPAAALALPRPGDGPRGLGASALARREVKAGSGRRKPDHRYREEPHARAHSGGADPGRP